MKWYGNVMVKGKDGKFIPELIVEYLKQNGVEYITSLPDIPDFTIDDIIKYCEKEGEKTDDLEVDFNRLIREAVSFGYDKRYFMIDEKEERKIFEKEFCEGFSFVLNQLGLLDVYPNLNVIVVGVGNGSECEMLYSDIKNISIVDVAPESLNRSKRILPDAKSYQEFADSLKSVADSNFDLYLSLRTYQSTYFNIFLSLKEAKRVLKKNGALIISIACGYLNEQNDVVYGLFNPHNGVLEKERPNLFVEDVIKCLRELGFEIVGTKKIPTEIFIYAFRC